MDETIGGLLSMDVTYRSEWVHHSDRDVLAAVDMQPHAFGELYQRHAGGLFRYLRSRCGNSQDALDLLGETFAVALDSLDRYDPAIGDPGGWLFGIARNLVRQMIRGGGVDDRARIRLGVRAREVDDGSAERIDEVVDIERTRGDLESGLRELPDDLAVAVDLRYHQDLDYPEIADRLGISVAAARKRVSRGVGRLSRGVDNPFWIHS